MTPGVAAERICAEAGVDSAHEPFKLEAILRILDQVAEGGRSKKKLRIARAIGELLDVLGMDAHDVASEMGDECP